MFRPQPELRIILLPRATNSTITLETISSVTRKEYTEHFSCINAEPAFQTSRSGPSQPLNFIFHLAQLLYLAAYHPRDRRKSCCNQPLFIPQSETSYENYFPTSYSYQAFIEFLSIGIPLDPIPFLQFVPRSYRKTDLPWTSVPNR